MSPVSKRGVAFILWLCRTLSWVFADLGAKLDNPNAIFSASNGTTKILEIVGIVACLVIAVAGCYFGRKYTKEIMDRKEREKAAELAGTRRVLLPKMGELLFVLHFMPPFVFPGLCLTTLFRFRWVLLVMPRLVLP
jgi:uncharacterized membrane protein